MPNLRVLPSVLTDIFNFLTQSVCQSVTQSVTQWDVELCTWAQLKNRNCKLCTYYTNHYIQNELQSSRNRRWERTVVKSNFEFKLETYSEANIRRNSIKKLPKLRLGLRLRVALGTLWFPQTLRMGSRGGNWEDEKEPMDVENPNKPIQQTQPQLPQPILQTSTVHKPSKSTTSSWRQPLLTEVNYGLRPTATTPFTTTTRLTNKTTISHSATSTTTTTTTPGIHLTWLTFFQNYVVCQLKNIIPNAMWYSWEKCLPKCLC